jgi:hypothetical protein
MNASPDDFDAELSEFLVKARNQRIRIEQLELECESIGRAYELLKADYERVIADNERMAGQVKTIHRENGIVIRTHNAIKQMIDACFGQIKDSRGNVSPLRGAPTPPHRPADSDPASLKVVRDGPRSA